MLLFSLPQLEVSNFMSTKLVTCCHLSTSTSHLVRLLLPLKRPKRLPPNSTTGASLSHKFSVEEEDKVILKKLDSKEESS